MIVLLSLIFWSELSIRSGGSHLSSPKKLSMLVLLSLTHLRWGQYPDRRESPFLPEKVKYVFPPFLNHLKQGLCTVRRLSPSLPDDVKYIFSPLLDHLKWGQCPVRRLSPFPEEVKYDFPPLFDHQKWGQWPVRRQSPFLPEEVKYVGHPLLDLLKWGQWPVRRPSLPEEGKNVFLLSLAPEVRSVSSQEAFPTWRGQVCWSSLPWPLGLRPASNPQAVASCLQLLPVLILSLPIERFSFNYLIQFDNYFIIKYMFWM